MHETRPYLASNVKKRAFKIEIFIILYIRTSKRQIIRLNSVEKNANYAFY